MDFLNKNKKEKAGKKDPKKPTGPQMPDNKQFWVNLLTTIVIFFLLISTYSIISDRRADDTQIPISQLAVDVTSGIVDEIIFKGDQLEIIYNDETEKESKKESGTALTDTLANYDVPIEH